MKPAPLPYLNLDAATALALPLAEVEARAQVRFCFRLPNGDEEWLLARLCVVDPERRGERCYCVILLPENAEVERIIVAKNLRYRDGNRSINAWMTPAQVAIWDWDLFAQSFNDERYDRRLERFWKTDEAGQTTLLKFKSNGWGTIYGATPKNKIEQFILARKRPHARRDAPPEPADMRFLRMHDADFCRVVRALWEDSEGPIQTALRWSRLSDKEKRVIAFECERGSWTELREVARRVLTVYAAHVQNPADHYRWNFVDYGYITVNRVLKYGDKEPALQAWRSALTTRFGTRNVDSAGVKIDSLPLCLWSYVSKHELSIIEVAPPTMHETMEAQLKLRDWTNAHFAPDEAARLLELLLM